MTPEPEELRATLPPPKPPKKSFLLKISPATTKVLYELAGLRGEYPGVVAKHIVEAHASQELAKTRAALFGRESAGE